MKVQINKETIVKNLTGILCGAMILSFLLPFKSAGVEINGIWRGDTISGFNLFELFTGVMLFLCPVVVLIACYLPRLRMLKNIICLVASVASFVFLLITFFNTGGEANASVGVANFKIVGNVGFWFMLIFSLALVGLSIVQFFNLKGNKIFDAVNVQEEARHMAAPNPKGQRAAMRSEQQDSMPGKDQEQKIETEDAGTQETKTETVKHAFSNAMNKLTSSPASPVRKENPEEIMERLKKLNELKSAGILTEEEFMEKKQEMLKKM